jgi:hypothetical protein
MSVLKTKIKFGKLLQNYPLGIDTIFQDGWTTTLFISSTTFSLTKRLVLEIGVTTKTMYKT